MNNTITMESRTENLTKQEQNKLKRMVLGYGNFKRIAGESGVHFNTFRNIVRLGYGTPASIQKIRENILSTSEKTAA